MTVKFGKYTGALESIVERPESRIVNGLECV